MSRSRDREWRNGYRAGIEDALAEIQALRLTLGPHQELAAAFVEVKKLLLVNPRGPEQGAARRYNLEGE